MKTKKNYSLSLTENTVETLKIDNLSAYVDDLLEKQLPKDFVFEVKIRMSKKYLRSCAVAGKPAQREIMLTFPGQVPPEIVHVVHIEENRVFLNCRSIPIFYRDNHGHMDITWTWGHGSDSLDDFDEIPTLSEIVSLVCSKKITLTEADLAEEAAEKARVEKIMAEKKEKEAKEKEAKEKAEEEEKANLLSWANEHGSELLKKRIAGGYEWAKLAREEYAKQIFASLGKPIKKIADRYDDAKEPSLKAIEALSAMKEKIAKINTFAKISSTIFNATYYEDFEEGEEERKIVEEIQVQIDFASDDEAECYPVN